MSTLGHGIRFVRGMRGYLREHMTVDEAHATTAERFRTRSDRFLASADTLIWSLPTSPYLPMLRHAGIGREDLARLVRTHGLDATLGTLRDEGVYVAYEEYTGAVPARRGSATFDFTPQAFFNPTVRADFTTGTSGTRSGGLPVASTFADMRYRRAAGVVTRDLWGVYGAPAAVWKPARPGGGLGSVIKAAGRYSPPQRWFSHTPVNMARVPMRERAASWLLPVAGRAAGVRLPRPEHVPSSDLDPVLAWCAEALAAHGRATVNAYTSSAARMAAHAADRGVRLDGLVFFVGGEPLTKGRGATIRASGAVPANGYVFGQLGKAGQACPACPDEELHVLAIDMAVVTRPRTRADGVAIDAFLWTSIHAQARSIFLNVESDDYGSLTLDDEPCSCALGQIGIRQRLSRVRGMSKVLAGGMTINGDVFEQLVEEVLPQRFGGRSGEYQFVEEERGPATVLTLRIDPRVASIDERAVLDTVRAALRQTMTGVLADEVWAGTDTLRIERAEALPARSGKVLPLERLVS